MNVGCDDRMITFANDKADLGHTTISTGLETSNTDSSTIHGDFFPSAEVFALLGCYAVLVGSWLPTFRNELSAPYSRIRQSKKKRRPRVHPSGSLNSSFCDLRIIRISKEMFVGCGLFGNVFSTYIM